MTDRKKPLADVKSASAQSPCATRTRSGRGFKAYFTHWRSKKVLWAKDYGYKGWPF